MSKDSESVNAESEQSTFNSTDATAQQHEAGDEGSVGEHCEGANDPSSDEHPSKAVVVPHQETRKEKRERMKRHKQIAKKLKNRNARNMRRKVLHACFGLTFAGLNHLLPKATFVPCMAFLSCSTLVMELLRYRKGFGWMNTALHGVLGQSLRKHEMEGKFTGSFYFFTGVTLTSWLFDSTSATLGICQLALADPSASYFGRKTRHVYWSRIENGFFGFGRNKGVLGFLGGALFCFPFNFRILQMAVKHSGSGASTIKATMPVLAAASILLGLAGAFADLAVPTPALVLPKKIIGIRVPPFHLDDNMVVPIFSAYACQEIFKALQLSPIELSRWVLF
jgi:dolichol kinase